MEDLTHSQLNHDLLIRLDEQVKALAITLELMRQTSIADLKDLRVDVEQLKMWRWILSGAIAIIMALVIPLVVYIFNSSNHIQNSVAMGIQEALSNFKSIEEK